MPGTTLILGGARSGKSRFAESLLADKPGDARLYLATAEARDAEMAERIARHRADRGSAWITIEEPLEIAPIIQRECGLGRYVLVECLTLWLSNLMEAGRDVAAETGRLCAALPQPGSAGGAVLVSNEVGLGIMPMNALARAFGDEAGRLNQRIAAAADKAYFIAAGLPLKLKGE
ncbi:bifunctional adenosylcobinamide kinase/adenosylcobinamide-phosphate guanylyltransferase [Ferrovibrio sp.]|uniref:bifunctional adenosylcobinamide kinase/adenosylcobinamide-phosphate guanylyltransferase n=1 Tax=Ferrovibrio sp. TaxID=1917215 RepID=UPI001B53CDC0|nr:bifunctional adenosylcobinamide kinase/adenosylcobinamide-phosphate guanylyltransferase [Ferrovibrio sp.]MBP7063246.1 bifunctional adenosylcobinamide kinase/adenosylcobinamide-phosphate guanylyltransferase [Ferrovibrio sp.]